MPKIAMIGAGSVVFAKNLMGDILSFPELAESEIALMDIDPERLRVAEKMAGKVVQALHKDGKTNVKPCVTATLDRREALKGADYVINMIQVGGYPSTKIDFDIPNKYGLKQTIADTLGIGGIFRSLRTIPVMLDMCREMEELCPGVQFLNYVNPMAPNTWAVSKATGIRTVGLCHSVQGTSHQIARYVGKDPHKAKLDYLVAGINHVAFFLRYTIDGEDVYPLLRARLDDETTTGRDPVRFEMFKRLGYFVTESSEHFAEYCPYFIKTGHPELVEQFHVPLNEYLRRCYHILASWERTKQMVESDEPITVRQSVEYGSLIVHSMETGEERTIYGNVLNEGLIDNLPQGCCVEVPCLVDKGGLRPQKIGALPPQLAAIMRTNVNVQELIVEACLTGKKEHVYHAAMMDPHTASELPLDKIWALCDDLFEAHGNMLPPLK
jgi:alpha-galactosidase